VPENRTGPQVSHKLGEKKNKKRENVGAGKRKKLAAVKGRGYEQETYYVKIQRENCSKDFRRDSN